ncbi:tyrosine-type recombinase/integrase [Streptomyces broussonetiae]|uniref:tyrosine-type recombinase/integrase n=1 Tax=Streptomyces broussonetiae TaxID=2686304 RepID=UPI0018EF1657|nr:tyrosine-type recombinase/integrase [Streptomyces broussonetiae]
MLDTLDRSTLIGKRDAALLVLGYAAAARVSELVTLDLEDLVETEEGIEARIYRRKLQFTETALPYGSSSVTCPVRTFRAVREAMATVGPTQGPLFVRIDRHGRIAPPLVREGKPIGDPSGRVTAEAAADVVERAAAAAGLTGRWRGHSLRRGFATAARRAGHDLVRLGRHWRLGRRLQRPAGLLGGRRPVDREPRVRSVSPWDHAGYDRDRPGPHARLRVLRRARDRVPSAPPGDHTGPGPSPAAGLREVPSPLRDRATAPPEALAQPLSSSDAPIGSRAALSPGLANWAGSGIHGSPGLIGERLQRCLSAYMLMCRGRYELTYTLDRVDLGRVVRVS